MLGETGINSYPLVWSILTDIHKELSLTTQINFGQFVALLEKYIMHRPSQQRLREIFSYWDEDGNGDIDLFNLVAVSEDVG